MIILRNLLAIGCGLGIFFSDSAAASCSGLRDQDLSACVAMTVVRKGESCDLLNKDPFGLRVCQFIQEIADGTDCEKAIFPSGSSERLACVKLLQGFINQSCSRGGLPPLAVRPFTGAAQLYGQSYNRICDFGAYLAKNHQFLSERRERGLLRKKMPSISPNFNPEHYLKVQDLMLRLYPWMKEKYGSRVSADAFFQYLLQLVQVIEGVKPLLLDPQAVHSYYSSGTVVDGHSLPSPIHVVGKRHIIVHLNLLQIPSGERVRLTPLGEGSYKRVNLGIDYDQGKPIAVIEVVHRDPAAFHRGLAVAINEFRLKSQWENLDADHAEKYAPSVFFDLEGHQKILMLDELSKYNLANYIVNVLNNPIVQSIEGFSKETIKIDLSVALLRQLDRIHQTGVHHRDIKPENILVDFRDTTYPIPRIIDAGSAYDPHCPDLSERRRQLRECVGTPCFMSPEYAEAYCNGHPEVGNQNLKTDVWAMGLTFWNLWHGKSHRIPRVQRSINLLYRLSAVKSYHDLWSELGIHYTSGSIPNQSTYDYLIYRMVDPSIGLRHRLSAKEALQIAKELQQNRNQLGEIGFRFHF